MTNSADPDQLTSSEANWSESTLFAKVGYIWVQQDLGLRVDPRSVVSTQKHIDILKNVHLWSFFCIWSFLFQYNIVF